MYVFSKFLVASYFAIFFSRLALAQKRSTDVSGWISLAIEQKINKRFSYQAMARVRDNNHFKTISSYYIDLGMYYKMAKTSKISLHGVYAPSRMSDQGFRRLYQYYIAFNQKFPINAYWYISNRIIGQHTSSNLLMDNGYKPYSRTDAREKIAVNARVTKSVVVYIGNEWMMVLSRSPIQLRRNRFYAGINYKITRQCRADCFFVLQSSFHKPKGDQNNYVMGVTFMYKFKRMMDDD